AESEKHHRAALALRRQILSADDPLITTSLENLADVFRRMAKYGDAVPLFREALKLHSGRLGTSSTQLVTPLRNLAYALNFKEGRNDSETREAFDLFAQIVALRENASHNMDEGFLADIKNAATLASDINLLDQAKHFFARHVEAASEFYGKGNQTTAYAYSDLASTLGRLRDFEGADAAFANAIEESIGADGRLSAATAIHHYRYGNHLAARGEFERAERAFRETLDIERQIFGEEHKETINSYNRLGLLLYNAGKITAAEPILQRARSLAGIVHGTDSLWYATTTDNLALALAGLGRQHEAIPLHQQALEIRERELGRDDADTSRTINNLGLALKSTGDYQTAEALFREALQIDRQRLAPNDEAIGIALNNLARVLEAKWDAPSLMEAAPMYAEALTISRANFPPTHPDIAYSIHAFASVVLRVHRMARGTPFSEQTGQMMTEASKLYREAIGILSAPVNRDAIRDNAGIFQTATAQLMLASENSAADAFIVAQWPLQSAASKAIAATSLRVAAGDDALGQLVRQQQDMTEAHAALNQRILGSLAAQNASQISALNAALNALERNLAALTEEITERFPRYAEYQGGEPVSANAVAAMLEDDEALVFINPGFIGNAGEAIEGSIFVVDSEGGVASALLEAGTGLQRDSEIVFCSIQQGAQNCGGAKGGDGNTRGAFSLDPTPRRSSLPTFNFELAHGLYKRIFEPVSEALAGKNKLIIVSADEALVNLPFQLLLTNEHSGDAERPDYQSAPWLIRKWAVTVSTSISALTASRAQPRILQDGGRKAFLGVGDPIIGTTGEIDCEAFSQIELASLSRGIVDITTNALFTGREQGARIADVNAVRRMTRLPDTRCELESVAASLGGGDLLLNADATETRIKEMNADNQLAAYDTISFATHGIVAGESNLAEPALVLTPPDKGSVLDDGLLTASEVAALKLNAEWVLLSACNTAAGTIETNTGDSVSESFSGLARAFFYAGARSLLVSHWPVQSEAAVRLTTKTFEILRTQPRIDRASAFRLAMLAILDDDQATDRTAHPGYWAPFTLLGTGQ
ncbi:MAG: CHAT domain-containing tetratricopeptide repeat protein, partial [Pseudomonadota bacterium]